MFTLLLPQTAYHEVLEAIMRKFALIMLTFMLLTTGSAQVFAGVFGSGTNLFRADESVIASLGAQAGVYNLLGLIGVRGTAEVSVYPDFGLSAPLLDASSYHVTELAGDALVSLGLLGVKGYAGIGGGVGTLYASSAFQARAVVGAEVYGLFAEVLPTYWYFASGSGSVVDVRARVGYNLHF
jgi:hypothetical protein